jgi:predicted GNAT family acetyltransferase
MHPLDNVIWHALTTRQTEFTQSFGEARRFVPEVGPLSAFVGSDEAGYKSLAGLVSTGGTVAVFLDSPYKPQPGWSVVAGATLLQMAWDTGNDTPQPDKSIPPITELGAADSPEMIELAILTKPGPFGPRTHELGNYFGIRHQGKLAAMAGERLKVPGYTEISAVCTHPNHTGKGYAAALMLHVLRGIRERQEVPFLHSRGDNVRAIEIYKRLGFRERKWGHFVVLRKE